MKAVNDSANDIEQVRANIDGVNEQIVRLLAERQQWVAAAGRLKRDENAVHAPDRVEQEIRKVRRLATDFAGWLRTSPPRRTLSRRLFAR